MDSCLRLGTGLGWRPAFAGYIERRTESSDLGFVEVLAEHVSGVDRDDGFYRDTHRHPVPRPVFDLLAELRSRCAPPGVLVEWDGHFPSEAELDAELRAVTGVLV